MEESKKSSSEGIEFEKFAKETIKSDDPRATMGLEEIQKKVAETYQEFSNNGEKPVSSMVLMLLDDKKSSCLVEGALTPQSAIGAIEGLEAALTKAIPEIKVMRLLNKLFGLK